jgi:DNA-directed RNA polymerase specialized sigma24 family protein
VKYEEDGFVKMVLLNAGKAPPRFGTPEWRELNLANDQIKNWLNGVVRFLSRNDGWNDADREDVVSSILLRLMDGGAKRPWTDERIVGTGKQLVRQIAGRVVSNYRRQRLPVTISPRTWADMKAKRLLPSVTAQLTGEPIQDVARDESVRQLHVECRELTTINARIYLEGLAKMLPERERRMFEVVKIAGIEDADQIEIAQRMGYSATEFATDKAALRRAAKKLLDEPMPRGKTIQ